eukprot:359718-Chlamydomonas_euryale.AAC.11
MQTLLGGRASHAAGRAGLGRHAKPYVSMPAAWTVASACSSSGRRDCAAGASSSSGAGRVGSGNVAAGGPCVLLTREAGKNDKMHASLSAVGMRCVELPLIVHTEGADRRALPDALTSGGFDWVAVTSPEAATVFLDAWEEAGQPDVRVAVVGAGTGEVLRAAGVEPAFTPSIATGTVMGAELPRVAGGTNAVLYPSSAKASSDLQNALAASGYAVRRLNTYNTAGVAPEDVPRDMLDAAMGAQIVTFGSPSAVKAWVALVGLPAASERLSVCIGSTSARACESAGLPMERVYHPASPGVDGWVESVLQACEEHGMLVRAA